jgi:hypothetical protein
MMPPILRLTLGILIAAALAPPSPAAAAGDEIAPVAPATCITPTYACVSVPVNFTRVDTTPVRGFSVSLTLSANLALCDSQIVQGPYLSSVGATNFQVMNNGGGSYTVDCAILGLPCGKTGDGTLFALKLTSSSPSDTGTVTVDSVTVRDCSNAPVSATPGPAATITIDNTTPAAIANLSAAQVTSANDGDGTTKITISYTAPGDAAAVAVYRAGYANYPEYDDAPGAGSVPATPGAYPPGAPWTLTAVTASGQDDEVATRDFWYYVAYVQDACGNWSGVSNQTAGTLNYHLGDVSDGTIDCQADNLVNTADVSLLGAHYGATLGISDPFGCLDVGPTMDFYVDARPTTDNEVNFEDLMMFAINYGVRTAPQVVREPSGRDELTVEGPASLAAGETFLVTLRLRSAEDIQGLSARLTWDASVAIPEAVEAGAWLAEQNGVAFSAEAGVVDAAVLGTGRVLSGEGVLATVRFRALRSGAPQVVLAAVDARSVENRHLDLAGTTPALPQRTALGPALPNPFRGETALSFSLAKAGPALLGIYSVDGRRVRTLAAGPRDPGTYRLVWDGRDDGGRLVSSGVYFVRLTTEQGGFRSTIVSLK